MKLLSIALLLFWVSPIFASCYLSLLRDVEQRSMSGEKGPPIIKSILPFDGEIYHLPADIAPAVREYLERSDITLERKRIMLKNLQGFFGGERNEKYNALHFDEDFHRLANGSKKIPDDTEDLVIVTHQHTPWQSRSAEMLQTSPLLKDIPVLSLHSMHFNLNSNNLYRAASEVRWSHMGEVDKLPSKAKRFHVFGGFCDSCLADTVDSIVKLQHKSDQPLDIYIHSSLSYSSSGQGNLAAALVDAGANPPKLSEILHPDVAKINDNPPTHVQTPHGPALRYQSDGPNPVNFYILAK